MGLISKSVCYGLWPRVHFGPVFRMVEPLQLSLTIRFAQFSISLPSVPFCQTCFSARGTRQAQGGLPPQTNTGLIVTSSSQVVPSPETGKFAFSKISQVSTNPTRFPFALRKEQSKLETLWKNCTPHLFQESVEYASLPVTILELVLGNTGNCSSMNGTTDLYQTLLSTVKTTAPRILFNKPFMIT